MHLFVVRNPRHWPLQIPGVEVVAARAYLTDPRYGDIKGAKVFNLCRSYSYMTQGYYVSLLAEARGHRPIPSILTLQDMQSQAMFRVVSDELDDLMQQSLSALKTPAFELSIYFGKNLAKRYDRLSRRLFEMFEVPLLRVQFERQKKRWQLTNVMPVAVIDIPDSHRAFVVEAAQEYFKRGSSARRPKRYRYDLAILHNPEEAEPPSDETALKRFERAADKLGLAAERVTRADYRRIPEFDALFIRETTYVDHHTYRFSRRAAAEGLVVIDDPESIIRCTNKVYLAEMFERYNLPAPRTVIVHRDNAESVSHFLTLPIILKTPDSSFSQGVIKAEKREDVARILGAMLEDSELVIAQEFMPTEFDWRVGTLAGEALYVCKYYMAHHHWQILKRDRKGQLRGGRVETIRVEDAPPGAVKLALRAARLVGDGFYGVDIKQVGRRFFIMEINDNPSVDAGYEDAVLKEELYARIMRTFLRRIEQRKGA